MNKDKGEYFGIALAECKEEMYDPDNVRKVYILDEECLHDKHYQCKVCGRIYINDNQAQCCCHHRRGEFFLQK
jgi:hypothetical protein